MAEPPRPFVKGRDNRGYYNSNGSQHCCFWGNTVRVPSLKAGDKEWESFYRLFPEIKEHLSGGRQPYCGEYNDVELDEAKGVYIVRKRRRVGGLQSPRFIVKTYKYKKVW